EAIRRLKIHDDQEKGGDDSGSYPDRPGEPDCVYYLRNGVCGYGVNCRYNHPQYAAQGSQFKEELPERVGEPDCGYYLKTGTCKYGSTCKYHHPKDRNGAGPVSYNLLGLPMRQDEKSCPYYMRTGACKFGGACKFHHPQPASLEAGVPLAGLSTYGSTGSSLIPTAGLPYVGGLPTWSLPRVPYMPAAAAPRLESPQAFAPLYISPSQGIPPPAQGWNTYVGNLSPMSSPSILGSNLVFNSRNHESASNGQVHLMPALTSNLPQRPDQPECRHFMNTGTCKYGSDCKYHHPKERTPQLVTNAGPAGLPSRPVKIPLFRFQVTCYQCCVSYSSQTNSGSSSMFQLHHIWHLQIRHQLQIRPPFHRIPLQLQLNRPSVIRARPFHGNLSTENFTGFSIIRTSSDIVNEQGLLQQQQQRYQKHQTTVPDQCRYQHKEDDDYYHHYNNSSLRRSHH
ncbi:Zinc finger CCCH domain-containing protein 3, partial [Linum perenne]